MWKTSLPWWTSSLREEKRCTGIKYCLWICHQNIFEMISNICIRGYVDDPRNTDNAWMETVAFNFHDPSGQEVCFNKDRLILLHFLKETLYLHRLGSYLCRQEMMLEQYSGCLSTKRYFYKENVQNITNRWCTILWKICKAIPFAGDTICKPQGLCWKGCREIGSPLVI